MKLDQSVEIFSKSPDVNLETQPDIKVVRNNMAAVVSSRFEPILRDFYQKLLKNGKPKKVALTAVMRKLLIHLNSLMRKHLEEVAAAA